MTFLERLFLLDRMHHLIRRKGTGTPKALADRLNVSERTVYNLVGVLRDLGAEIYFCNSQCSYCYSYEVVFNFIPKVDNGALMKGGRTPALGWFMPASSNLLKRNWTTNFRTAKALQWMPLSL